MLLGQSSSPPQITGFLSHDLVKPDEVKFARRFDASQNWSFRLPCEASGAHSLQWRWQHNGTDIVYGAKYKLGDDGSLTGEYLVAENSGNYQCFVRDTVTAKEVFSRRLKVAVTCESLHFNIPIELVQVRESSVWSRKFLIKESFTEYS